MMKINRIFLSTLLSLLIVIAISNAGLAQSDIRVSNLQIDLWPEYDRSSVLVIYHIALSPDLIYPVDIKLRIPTKAGEPNAVAMQQADGGLTSVTYERTVNGEWSEIKFAATIPQIQLEYYDPQLTKDGIDRHFKYHWPGDYAVNSVTIQIQQPVGASDVKTVPEISNTSTGKDGLTYFTSEAGSLAVNQTFDISLDYKKSNDSFSAESLKVKPITPVSRISTTQRTFMDAIPWILGVLGVILIIGAVVWWYWLSGVSRSQSRTAHKKRRFVISQAETTIPEGNIYCSHCGKRAQPGDRFCRTCGTKLQ